MSVIEQAYQLADNGQAAAAAALLEKSGRSGDAAAWLELGVWLFSAQYLPRDLARARDCFSAAGRLGHLQAEQIAINLLANGVGGPRDWPAALSRLRTLSTHDTAATRQLRLIEAMDLDQSGDPATAPVSEELSKAPAVTHFPAFLTAEECDYLVEQALPSMSPSVVVDPTTGRLIPHPVRTSENTAFPWLEEDPAIHAINRRIASASGSGPSCGEPLQVLRYRPGQEYRPHHDALPGADNQRVLTFLLYLNEGYSGGETEFLKTGLRFAGHKGDGLLFRNADVEGRPDPAALHAGRPVTAGEKLLATRWIHERPFGPL